jgi:hypothetical protein
LIGRQPLERVFDDVILDGDVRLSLAEGSGHKSRQPGATSDIAFTNISNDELKDWTHFCWN